MLINEQYNSQAAASTVHLIILTSTVKEIIRIFFQDGI